MTSVSLGTATGQLEFSGDHDWIRLSLKAGTSYMITGTGYKHVELHDAAGALLTSSLPASSIVVFTPKATANYYVDVSDVTHSPGGYTVSLSSITDDCRDNPSTAAAVAVGGTFTGSLDAGGDHDWIRMELAADTEYVLAAGLATRQLTMLDGFGRPVAATDASGKGSLAFTPKAGGTYFVDVSDAAANGSYTLSLATAADDYLSNGRTGGAVNVGASINGQLAVAGDHDWIRVALAANTQYLISAGANDRFLQIHGPQGNPVPTGEAKGPGQLAFTPALAGDYYVDVSGLGGATGAYTLSVATATDDCRSNVATTASVAVGSSFAGQFEAVGDHDWVKVNLTANTQYLIADLNGRKYFQIFDAAGQPVAAADALGLYRVAFTPRLSGNYYVDISEYDRKVATYGFSVTAVADDYLSNKGTTASLAPGATLSGQLAAAGDHDWMRLDLAANRQYEIVATSTHERQLQILDANGAPLKAGDAAGKERLAFTPATAGTYYLDVSDPIGATGGYSISLKAVADDFADNAGTTAFIPLLGTASNNYLAGTPGADVMLGLGGTDVYLVNNAKDRIYETTAIGSTVDAGGFDIVKSSISWTLGNYFEQLELTGSGHINATGNALNNNLLANAGNNILDGRGGRDMVSYQNAPAGVTVSLATTAPQATGGSGTDTLLNIEHLHGSVHNDVLTGNGGNNILNGLAGSDTLAGGLGNDTYVVSGPEDVITELPGQGYDMIQTSVACSLTDTDGAGANGGNVENLMLTGTANINGTGNGLNNQLYPNAGNNILDGVTGFDTVSYRDAPAAVKVSLATTLAQATGGSGSDTLRHIDALTGSRFADTLAGNADANVLDGGAGNDTLAGGGGVDLLIGGSGRDSLSGGAGADIFQLWAAADSAPDGARDVIADFGADDRINLKAMDADTAAAGDQAFVLTVGDTFSGVFANPGELYFDGTNGILYGNVDGDAQADFSIKVSLQGIATLAASDFVL